MKLSKSKLLVCTIPANLVASFAAPAAAQEVGLSDDASVRNQIVVTAQKREQVIEQVPLSISVISGNDLLEEGAVNLVDYSGFVPSMEVNSAGTPGQGSITLRGIASLSGASSTGLYLDDAPIGSSNLYSGASSFMIDLIPYDLSRIEVLRGPQGTLYGASTIGGLVKYVTRRPNLTGSEARARGEIFGIKGAHDIGWSIGGYITTPVVTDKVAISGSYAFRESPGWVNSIANPDITDQNSYQQEGGRAAILVAPNDRLEVSLTGLWQKINADGNGVYIANLAGVRLGDGTSYNNVLREGYDFKIEYYSGTIDYDFGALAFTSATSYSETASNQDFDSTYIFGPLFPLLTGGVVEPGVSLYENDLTLEKFTQEFRIASPTGRKFEWMVGAFYTHEKTTNRQYAPANDLSGNPIPALNPIGEVHVPATYKEYAAFAHSTWKLTERFALNAGVRWAKNEQTFRQISSGVLLPTADNPGNSSEDVFTYSVSPQFWINNDQMIYARIASGYRPGGPNVTLIGVPPQVGSDTLTNYEFGYKGDIANGLVTIDLAAFWMDWKDIQVAVSFGATSGYDNGGTATSKGLEGTMVVRPMSALSLTLTGSYIDSKLTEDVPDISGQKGDRIPNAPVFSGGARLDYDYAIGPQIDASLGLGFRHAGSRLSLVESDPLSARSKSYSAVDFDASFTFSEHYTLRFYGRNLFNNQGEVNRTLLVDAFNQPLNYSVTPIQPRTIGLALELAI